MGCQHVPWNQALRVSHSDQLGRTESDKDECNPGGEVVAGLQWGFLLLSVELDAASGGGQRADLQTMSLGCF